METLEERRLLAAVSWDGGGGDNLWNNAANWNIPFAPERVPNATDVVTIGDALLTVRVDGAAAVGTLFSSLAGLVLSPGASLFIQGLGAAGASVRDIELQGAELIGGDPDGDGPLVAATLTTGGITTDRTRASSAIRNLVVSSLVPGTPTAVNVGAEDGFTFDGGGLFGALNVEDGANFSTINGWAHTGAFNIGNNVTGTISSGVSFDALTIGAGAAINFLAGGVVAGATSIQGAITLNAQMNFLGVVDLVGGSIGGGGTPRFAGTMNWSAGTIGGLNPTVPAGGTLNILTSAPKFVGALALNLEGTTNWSGTGRIGVAPPILQPVVVNRGTISITQSGSRGFERLADGGIGWFDFINEGSVDVGAGTFQAEHLGLGHPGDFFVASGAMLELDGGGLTTFGSISGAGSARLRWLGDSFGSINLGGTLSLPGGDVEFKGQVAATALEVGPPDTLWTSNAAFRGTTTITGDVTVRDAFAEFGMQGFGNTASIGGNLRVLDDPGPPGGGVTFHAALNLPTGTATFAGGNSRIHGTFLSPNTPVFSGGNVIFHSDTALPEPVLFGAGMITFMADLTVPDATFSAGTVVVQGDFRSEASALLTDPEFLGAAAEFHGAYTTKAEMLRINGGSVAFLNTAIDTHTFESVDLSGGGVLRTSPDRTPQQGPVTLVVTDSLLWGTGTIRNANVEVQQGATFSAGGGLKRFQNSFPSQVQFAPALRFDTLTWTSGNFELINNIGGFGGGTLASLVTKSGTGDIVTTTTVAPPGGGEWRPAITFGLFDHLWSGVTTIEGAYTPRFNTGHTHISAGELRLPEYAASPFYSSGVLATGQWTIHGTLTLAGATIHTIGSSAAVTMFGAGATFNALAQLSNNNGTLIYRNGSQADVTPAAGVFTNSGTLRFLGGSGVHHRWRKAIIGSTASSLVSVEEAGTQLTVEKGIKGAGRLHKDDGVTVTFETTEGPGTTVLEYTGPTPFTGEGLLTFVGDFETVFHADAQILGGELVLGTHRFSGAGAVTITSAVTYESLTVAPGAGAYRIGQSGSFVPASAGAALTLERSLVNDGLLDANVETSVTGMLTNGSTGEFVVQGVSGAGAFVNQGLLRAAAGTTARSITAAYTHASTLPFDLAGADLRIEGSITNNGTFAVDGAGMLDLDGVVLNASAVAFDGEGNIRFAPGASFHSDIDTEIRSTTLVLSDANALTGPGRIILAGDVTYGLLILDTGGSLVISASGSLTPASTASSLVLDRAVSVHGLLGGRIVTERAGIITIEESGILDLNDITGIGEVHNYGLIRNQSGVRRTISVPLLHASSQLLEAGAGSNIVFEGAVHITGLFGLTTGTTLRTHGPVVMTAGAIGGIGDVRVYGTFTLSGGAILGDAAGAFFIVESTGSLLIDHEGPGFIQRDRDIANSGTIEWRRGSLSGSGTLVNSLHSQFLLTAEEGEHVWSRSGSTTARVINFDRSTVVRDGAGGSQLFYIPVDNNVGSETFILGGDLGALGGGTWNRGAVIAAGSTLYLGSSTGEPDLELTQLAQISGQGNITIGGVGFDGTTSFWQAVSIGGDFTVLSGSTVFLNPLNAGGNLRIEGGTVSFTSGTQFGGFGTFSGGAVTSGSLTFGGTALFSGTTAHFSNFFCANAEFQSGSVTINATFRTNGQEPSFTGATVQFGGLYSAPTAHLLIQAGSVRFDDDITFNHVELLGGALLGDPTRSSGQGATRFEVLERLDWGGGLIQDLRVDVSVETGAQSLAFGGLKRISFSNTELAAPMTIGEMTWSHGDIDLRDGASLSGSMILKTGSGNLTRSTTIPPPGGGQWQGDVVVDLFQHAWSGSTVIDAQWNPGASGHMHVLQGGVTLTDQSEFISGNTLTEGIWTVQATLTLPGASITTTAAGTVVNLISSASSFAAINALATNGGQVRLAGGKTFSFLPTGTTFTNQGALYLEGGIVHTPQRTIINDGTAFIGANSTLRLDRSAFNGGTFNVGTTGLLEFFAPIGDVITHSGPQAYAGGGTVRVGFGTGHVFNADTVIDIGTFNQIGPHGWSGNATIEFHGVFSQASRDFGIGPGITLRIEEGATFISTGNNIILDGTLDILGALSGTSINLTNTSARITNQPTGVMHLDNRTISGAGTFDNFGTINVSGPGATVSVANYNHQSTIPFSINPAAARFDISSAVTNSGTFAVSGPGTLRLLVGANTVATHTGTNPFAGSGRIELLKANNFTAQDAVISATNIHASNMTFGGTGSVLLTGQMTLATGATIIFASDFTVGPTGRMTGIVSAFIRASLVNHGIMTAGSSFNLDQANAVFANAADGVLNLSSHTILGLGTFTNAGTMNVTAGNVGISVASYNHQSTIPFNIAGGSIVTISSATSTSSGTFAVNGGGLLILPSLSISGPVAFDGSGQIRAGGTLTFLQGSEIRATNINLESATFGGTGSITLTGLIAHGHWTLLTTGGLTIAPAGRMNLPAAPVNIHVPILNQGAIQTSGTVLQLLSPSAILTNALGASLGVSGSSVVTGVGSVVNHGTMGVTSGSLNLSAAMVTLQNRLTGFLGLSAGTILGSGRVENQGLIRAISTSTISSALDSAGRVQAVGGTLTLSGPLTQLVGQTLTAGRWSVQALATLTIPSASITTIGTQARVDVSGNGWTFNAINALNTVNGHFSLGAGRNFSTVGHLTNNGFIHLEGTVLTVNGNYTQNASGTLSLVARGPDYHGRIVATGTATLGGNLRVSFVPSYRPAPHTNFRLIQAATLTGQFLTASIGSLTLVYDPTGVNLIMRATPVFDF